MVKLSCTGHAKAKEKMSKWCNGCWRSMLQEELCKLFSKVQRFDVCISCCKDVTICISRAGDEGTKVQVDSTNTEGYTALHYACWQGHQKVVKLLKEAKADPRARYGEMECPKLSLYVLSLSLHSCLAVLTH